MTIDHPVEQAIRRSHCSHAGRGDPQHQCVGTCFITSQGITLDCKACGKDDRLIEPFETLPETKLVRDVLDALGITYEALSPEYKRRAADVARRWLAQRLG